MLKAVLNVPKLCSCRFVSAAHCLAATRHAYCPILFRRQLFTLSAVSRASSTSDADSNDVKTGTVRSLRRSKTVRSKRRCNFPTVAEQFNEYSAPVIIEMLASQDSCDSDPHYASLNAARTEMDEKLKELEEIANIEIRDINLAVETVDEPVEEEELTEKTEVQLSNYPDRAHQLFGSPDSSVPVSTTPCHGCGAILHCRDPGIPGYMPSQIFLAAKPLQLREILCQRCHMLKEYNLAVDVSVKPMEFQAIAREIKKKRPALLLIMVDIMDLPNSFYNGFSELVSKNCPAYIIGNKVDLLPRDAPGYLDRIKQLLLTLCEERGITAQHVALISAKTGYGIEKLISRLLRDWKLKGQVFILGCTNAGKSTLFNALLSSDFCRVAARDVLKRATASIWPGTTLNLLKFPIVNPKPTVLHRRVQRLHDEETLVKEEEQLRLQQFRASGRKKYATLMGHIGQSSPTPNETALNDFIARRYASGFVEPNYTFDTEVTADGQQVAELKEFTGRDALMNRLQIKIPPYDDKNFKFWCYDTPGLINPNQVINMLNTDELMVLLDNELVLPRTFHVEPTQVTFVSGLGRIDYVQGEAPVYFTVFAASGIPVHVVNSNECDEFYRANVGSAVLGIPLGDQKRLDMMPSLLGRHIEFEGTGWQESSIDVILSSIGWVSVTADEGMSVSLRAYTPRGLGCSLRSPALLKYAVNQRGKRFQGKAAFRTRRPTFCFDS